MNWFDRVFKPWRPKCSVHSFDEPIAVRLYDGQVVKFYLTSTHIDLRGRITAVLQDCKTIDRMYKL